MNQAINTVLNKTFMSLPKRSETSQKQQLVETFVQMGALPTLLKTRDHQIIYGRRGTGKTHALRYLESELEADGNIPIFIDLRTMGSTNGIYSDSSLSISERASRLLVDALSEIHEKLHSSLRILDDDKSRINLASYLPLLDELAEAITEVRVVGKTEITSSSSSAIEANKGEKINASLKPLCLSIESKTGQQNLFRDTLSQRRAGVESHSIHLGRVGKCFREITFLLDNVSIWLLLDEWSSLPNELQPFLADLLKKSIFPVTGIIVKICAIEHRSQFINKQNIGIELGADATADVNLDEYLVFDNAPINAISFFKNLILKHVSTLLSNKCKGEEIITINTADDLIKMSFTDISAFKELVIASEGVPRDAINILSQAAQKAGDKKISINNVKKGAHIWYTRDKQANINANEMATRLLNYIVEDVIGKRQARAFLLRADLIHPLINLLFDNRLIHILKKGVSAKDEPGIRYNVYKLDYGLYVDLLQTSEAPKGLMEVDTDGSGFKYIQIPIDDYRAIRRAILDMAEYRKKYPDLQL